MNVAVY